MSQLELRLLNLERKVEELNNKILCMQERHDYRYEAYKEELSLCAATCKKCNKSCIMHKPDFYVPRSRIKT